MQYIVLLFYLGGVKRYFVIWILQTGKVYLVYM